MNRKITILREEKRREEKRREEKRREEKRREAVSDCFVCMLRFFNKRQGYKKNLFFL